MHGLLDRIVVLLHERAQHWYAARTDRVQPGEDGSTIASAAQRLRHMSEHAVEVSTSSATSEAMPMRLGEAFVPPYPSRQVCRDAREVNHPTAPPAVFRACLGPFCGASRDILRIYGFEGQAPCFGSSSPPREVALRAESLLDGRACSVWGRRYPARRYCNRPPPTLVQVNCTRSAFSAPPPATHGQSRHF